MEQRAIELALQTDKFEVLADAGLEAEHFTDKTLSVFYKGCIEATQRSEKADKIYVAMSLRESGAVDEVQLDRIMDLDGLPGESGGLFIGEYAEKIIAASNRRRADELTARAILHRKDGNDEQEAELLGKAADLLKGSKSISRWDNLQAKKFDPKNPVEPTTPIIEARGCPLAARANLTVLEGADKSGKSHVMAAIIRAITEGGTYIGISAKERGKVLYIDCEQASEDFDELLRTQGNGNHTAPEAYCLTGESPGQCRSNLELILQKTPGFAAVLLDGFADLVNDVNDAEEAVELVAWLMSLAAKYDVAIIGVIHLNPGSDSKSRGHLGSQLGRKARAVLTIVNDGETRTLYTRRARKKGITQNQGIRFAWSDEEHCFVEIEGTPGDIRQAQKAEELTRILQDVQAETGMLAWKHGELVGEIEKAARVKDRAARNKIIAMLEAGILKHNGTKGIYTSSLENGTDDECT